MRSDRFSWLISLHRGKKKESGEVSKEKVEKKKKRKKGKKKERGGTIGCTGKMRAWHVRLRRAISLLRLTIMRCCSCVRIRACEFASVGVGG